MAAPFSSCSEGYIAAMITWPVSGSVPIAITDGRLFAVVRTVPGARCPGWWAVLSRRSDFDVQLPLSSNAVRERWSTVAYALH
jgi:hypothetical protein